MGTAPESVSRQPVAIAPATGRQPHVPHVFPSYQMGGVPIPITTTINRLGNRFRHTIGAMDGVYECRSWLEPALAGALERLLAEPALRDEIGRRNRERVRAHYALDRVVGANRVLFEGVRGAAHADRARTPGLGRAAIK